MPKKRVGHRFPIFLEKTSSAVPALFFPCHSPPFFLFFEKSVKDRRKRGEQSQGVSLISAEGGRVRQNHLQFLSSCGRPFRSCARANANGGNRFTRISIIVIKHAASMNYLFVGTAEYTESKKKEATRKEGFESE